MKPITMMAQDRYPVHQAILFGLARLGTRECKDCLDKLDKQIAHDETAVRLPGARDLLGETRVTEAIIQKPRRGRSGPRRHRDGRRADEAPATAPKGKSGKGGKAGKAKGGKKKRK